jgi:hypothetical protein
MRKMVQYVNELELFLDKALGPNVSRTPISLARSVAVFQTVRIFCPIGSG